MPTAEDQESVAAGRYDLRAPALTRADANVLSAMFTGMDSELDGLLAAQAAAGDADSRNRILTQAQARVAELALYIPMNELAQLFGSAAGVNGTAFDAANMASFYGTWLTTD